tara:strand:- start:98 stop:400 length:303 start_codon:yes stop_codon:yes gene_type:complete
MSLDSVNENKYNGWTNYATWKIMLELFDGVEFYNPLDADEVKHIVDEYLLDGLMIDTPLQPMSVPKAMEYARHFTELADYDEMADAINERNQENFEDGNK